MLRKHSVSSGLAAITELVGNLYSLENHSVCCPVTREPLAGCWQLSVIGKEMKRRMLSHSTCERRSTSESAEIKRWLGVLAEGRTGFSVNRSLCWSFLVILSISEHFCAIPTCHGPGRDQGRFMSVESHEHGPANPEIFIKVRQILENRRL